MSSTVTQDFNSTFRILSELPVPIGARFIPDAGVDRPAVRFQAAFSVRDNDQNLKRSVIREVTVVNGVPLSLGSVQEASKEVVAALVSPSGTLEAILREATGEQGKKRSFVEIWNRKTGKIETKREVTETHGAFYKEDPYLSSLAFSSAEDALIYNAEAKSDSTSEGLIQQHYTKFRYIPSFGEGFRDKKQPSVYIFRWGQNMSSSLSTLTLPNHPIIFGQALFHPFIPNVLYATGWETHTDGKRLGIKGCFNRPSGIWEITIASPSSELKSSDKAKDSVTKLSCQFVKLTNGDLSCRSPRLSFLPGDKKAKLVWIANPTGGAHASTASLHCLTLSNDQELVKRRAVTTVVSSKWEPSRENRSFPGLYPDASLPSYPFTRISGQAYMAVHSMWGSRTTVLLINLDSTDDVIELTAPSGACDSWKVLATDGTDHILCSKSTPIAPHQLWLVKLGVAVDGRHEFIPIGPDGISQLPETLRQALSPESFRIEVIPIPDCYPTETIVIHPTTIQGASNDILPCVTFPHGGPHGTIATEFAPETISLALEGYTVSIPNYTGSLGFGERYVQALLGKCGTLDLRDCVQSVRHLISIGLAKDGPGKLFVMGGSHGGFVTAHLIGQYPDMFSAAVMRNPVISGGEVSSTDIPDWYFYEFGLSYYPPVASLPLAATLTSSSPSAHAPTKGELPASLWMPSATYETLQLASPIVHVQKVKTNVLLQLGGSDARVAPTQGIGYYHALRACGAVGLHEAVNGSQQLVEVLWFDGEGHPLEGVEAFRVGWECAVDWFKRATK